MYFESTIICSEPTMVLMDVMLAHSTFRMLALLSNG